VARPRLCFLSILGEPGTYDPAVYEGIKGGDDDRVWFADAFGHLPGVTIRGYRISHGDPIPAPHDGDLFVLGGSYNSVHDGFDWQRRLYPWFDALRAAGKPLLAICGGHQLLCRHLGAWVERLPGGTVAGTMAVAMTGAGRASPLFRGLGPGARFHFANAEHVPEPPEGARVLATHDAVPIAALDFGGGWFSTQFHPEATVETMKRCIPRDRPALSHAYRDDDAGARMMANFIALARKP